MPRPVRPGSAALIQQAGAAVPRRDLAPVTPDAVWQALTTGESPAEVPLGVLVPQLIRIIPNGCGLLVTALR